MCRVWANNFLSDMADARIRLFWIMLLDFSHDMTWGRFTVTAVDLRQTIKVSADLEIRAYYAGHVSSQPCSQYCTPVQMLSVVSLLTLSGPRIPGFELTI